MPRMLPMDYSFYLLPTPNPPAARSLPIADILPALALVLTRHYSADNPDSSLMDHELHLNDHARQETVHKSV